MQQYGQICAMIIDRGLNFKIHKVNIKIQCGITYQKILTYPKCPPHADETKWLQQDYVFLSFYGMPLIIGHNVFYYVVCSLPRVTDVIEILTVCVD